MSFTQACYVGLALESRGLPAAANHQACSIKGGAIYQFGEPFFPLSVAPCECECHAKQDRSWMPKVARYEWELAGKRVRLAI